MDFCTVIIFGWCLLMPCLYFIGTGISIYWSAKGLLIERTGPPERKMFYLIILILSIMMFFFPIGLIITNLLFRDQ